MNTGLYTSTLERLLFAALGDDATMRPVQEQPFAHTAAFWAAFGMKLAIGAPEWSFAVLSEYDREFHARMLETIAPTYTANAARDTAAHWTARFPIEAQIEETQRRGD